MKTIETLIPDIYEVISEKGGWDTVVNEYFKERLGETMMSRLTPPEEEYKPSLRMSNVGKPCARQLWYDVNEAEGGEELPPYAHLKFLYGDILEDLLVSLALAAGHTVEGEQDTMVIRGIKGHRDCIIDGVLIDVKSASPFSFKKFKEHRLREDDPFGYIRQLSSYLYASQDDPLVKDKKKAGFFVIDKVHGHLTLDMYNLTKEMDNKEEFIEERKAMVASPTPPKKGFEEVPDGKSGNKKLGLNCSYCSHKASCYPGLRTFIYSRGPVFLTNVVREPNVPEVVE